MNRQHNNNCYYFEMYLIAYSPCNGTALLTPINIRLIYYTFLAVILTVQLRRIHNYHLRVPSYPPTQMPHAKSMTKSIRVNYLKYWIAIIQLNL